jgi:hypothetical protein
MQACHQGASGRSADSAAGIDLSEANTLCSHSVNVGRLNLPLSVAAQVAVTQVIRFNVNDVWVAGIALGFHGDGPEHPNKAK